MIWQTESEHVIPFAAGRSLWTVLNLVPTLRGMAEDNEQTTIVIYYRAARIKTPEDNQISAAYAAAARTKAPDFRRRYEIYMDARAEHERHPETAAPPDPTRVVNVLDDLEGAVLPLRTQAVNRTNDAIAAENRETEQGHSQTNSVRRGNEPPTPGPSDIAAAAAKQHNDVRRLLRDAVDNELGI